MTEMTPGSLHPAPAGTPHTQRSEVADVWCVHGVRWSHEQAGYLPAEVDAEHPDIPCLDAGAIPEECQPIVAYDPAEYPNAGPHGAAAARRDLEG